MKEASRVKFYCQSMMIFLKVDFYDKKITKKTKI